MVPENIHDFFLASGGIAGALIGLLFVAISVSGERLARQDTESQLHRVRASAALTAFLNALTVSLFSLVPGHKIGPTSVIVAVLGLGFVVAALLSLRSVRHIRWITVRDLLFLIGLLVVFVVQLITGVQIIATPDDAGNVNTVAVLVIICFLIGIARAWRLIGGPSIGLSQEVTELVRDRHDKTAESEDGQPSPS